MYYNINYYKLYDLIKDIIYIIQLLFNYEKKN